MKKLSGRYLCVLSADVEESVPVAVAQICRTLEALVAELTLSLARLQSVASLSQTGSVVSPLVLAVWLSRYLGV